MSFSNEDKQYIKITVGGAIEELAGMVARGFEGVDKRFEQIDKQFEGVDKRFEQIDKQFEGVDKRFEQIDQNFKGVSSELGHINSRLSAIEDGIDEIKKHFVYRYEFEDLMARVKYLETKLGVESGK